LLHLFAADIATQYQVSKYPTLKLFRYGQPTKREYRGQRSVTSIASFVEDQLKDPLQFVSDLGDLNDLDVRSICILFHLFIFSIT